MNWKFWERESEAFVWVHADPDQPHVGIAHISEEKPSLRPLFKVLGIGYAQARLEIMGKMLDWSKVAPLKNGERESHYDVFKQWYR